MRNKITKLHSIFKATVMETKRKNALIFVVLVFILLPFSIYAQSISYTYDNSGNRIKREIVFSTRNKPGHSSVENLFTDDMLGDKNIRIYPNATKGTLKVEITGYESSDNGSILLHSMSGQMLMSENITSQETKIDISSYHDGVYILQINLNGKSISWKVLKN